MEFPGQFPGTTLYNLGVRDEEFWYVKAQKKEVLRQIELIRAARLAVTSDSYFRDEMTILSWEVRKLEADEKGMGE